ncbi:hypothetical protein C8F04DRAFT_1199621 [Mycena alexandri]|uniref:Uncharacterized protein n=1 Tax=Mycena alexandri TaxID=1745969 RepID=A0AAD6RYV1_9AGAR|nr:hypothetical protein C8F04DRAFT_1199621 [Mycena alexandri]
MSNPQPRDFEILRGPSYWKEFHEARRARLARAEVSSSTGQTFHALSQPDMVYTFVPGRQAPIVSVSGAPRRKGSTITTGGGAVRSKKSHAYVPHSGTNTHVAALTHEETQLLCRLRRSHKQRLIEAARHGYLREPGNFVGQSDDDIRAHLKTPRGKEQLAAAEKRTAESWDAKGRAERAAAAREGREEEGDALQLADAEEARRTRGPRSRHDRALFEAHLAQKTALIFMNRLDVRAKGWGLYDTAVNGRALPHCSFVVLPGSLPDFSRLAFREG